MGNLFSKSYNITIGCVKKGVKPGHSHPNHHNPIPEHLGVQNSEHLQRPSVDFKVFYNISEAHTRNDKKDDNETENEVEMKCINLSISSRAKSIELCSRFLVNVSSNIMVLQANLTRLQLCCNSIKYLPEEIGLLKNLKHLLISHNELVELPLSIGLLRNLVELRLNNNRLKTLPRSIMMLNKLKYLHLNSNDLVWIPEEVIGLNRLLTLDLSSNPLLCLPSEISRLKHLRRLKLNNCNMFKSCPQPKGLFFNVTKECYWGYNIKSCFVEANTNIEAGDNSNFEINSSLCHDPINWMETFDKDLLNINNYNRDNFMNSVSIFVPTISKPFNPFYPYEYPGFPVPISSNGRISMKGNGGYIQRTSEGNVILSDNPYYFPIPSLKELSSRQLLKTRQQDKLKSFRHIIGYLQRVKFCSFCHGPYIDSWTPRVRFIEKNNSKIPLLYRLCWPHWLTDEGRIESMFDKQQQRILRKNQTDKRTGKDRNIAFQLDYLHKYSDFSISINVKKRNILNSLSQQKNTDSGVKNRQPQTAGIATLISGSSLCYYESNMRRSVASCTITSPTTLQNNGIANENDPHDDESRVLLSLRSPLFSCKFS